MIFLSEKLRKLFVMFFSFSPVFLLQSPAFGGQKILMWDPNSEPNLAGYRVYVGTSPGVYGPFEDVGLNTQFSLSGLAAGNTYYNSGDRLEYTRYRKPPFPRVCFHD